jgi:hypothetical protein
LKTTPSHNSKIDFDTVLELGASLPGVKASSSKLGIALKLKGQLVACTAINPSAEPNSLMVRLQFSTRDALIEKQPDTYYLTPHYRGYPSVLVRLGKISRSKLRNLLEQAAQFMGTETKNTPKKTARKTAKKPRVERGS